MGAELGPPLSSGVCVRRALFILFFSSSCFFCVFNLHLVGFSVYLMTGVIVLKRGLCRANLENFWFDLKNDISNKPRGVFEHLNSARRVFSRL